MVYQTKISEIHLPYLSRGTNYSTGMERNVVFHWTDNKSMNAYNTDLMKLQTYTNINLRVYWGL